MEPINRFEERFMEYLYAIERPMAETCRAHPDLTDWDARDVIAGLIRTYQAEADNHLSRPDRTAHVEALREAQTGREPA